MVTVLVNYINLVIAVRKMADVRQHVENRSLQVSLETSKGEFAEELIVLAKRLEETGKVFAELAAKTETVLREAKKEFNQSDLLAAGQFQGTGQISRR